ncbi:MAG: hypothetical protein IPO27_19075 [Bacteroidetes bacterium]|nr:hypothetical protein [Bacteroidota bacterium]
MKVTKSINAPIVITLTLSAFTSCNAQVDREIKDIVEHAKTFGIGDTVSAMGTDLDCILQDNDSIYWFAGNGGGSLSLRWKYHHPYYHEGWLVRQICVGHKEDINGIF